MTMNITIHAEIAGVDDVQVYEGDSELEAMEFVNGLEKVTDIQCNLMNTSESGEKRTLARRAKGDAIGPLVEDIRAWLFEHLPAAPDEGRDEMTITANDVGKFSVDELGLK